MAITINGTTKNQPAALGLNRQFQFLGEGFRYRITKEVSISGNLLDLANSFGVGGITSEVENTIISFLNNWDEIIINGVSFGQGFMSSVSFSSGSDVRIKEYSASFTIYEDGDLSYLNPSISGLTASDLKFLDSISETFRKDSDQKTDSYTHSINITAIDAPSSGIDLAKAIAVKLFASEDFPALLWGNSKVTLNTYFSETYNKITNSCSFEKRYVLNDDLDTYLKSRTSTFDVAEDGVIKITETAEYTAKWDKTDQMIADAKSDMANAFTRCQSIYNTYKSTNVNLDTSAALYDKPIEKGTTITEKSGFVSYTVTFSNDLFYTKNYSDGSASGPVFWEYKLELETDEQNITTVKESGTIIGDDILKDLEKQNKANTFWKTNIKPGVSVPSRINSFYSKRIAPCTSFSLNLQNWSVTKSDRMGAVNYDISYTDDLSRSRGKLNNLKTLDSSCANQAGEQIKLSSNIVVPRFKEIKQPSTSNNIHEKKSISVSAVSTKTNNSLNFILDKLKTEAAICRGSDMYIESASYSYNPLNKTASLDLQTFKPT
jgi:hypothetical protein